MARISHLKTSEHQHQVAYFDWVRLRGRQDKKYRNIFAVPNGAWLADDSGTVKAKCKRCGAWVVGFSERLARLRGAVAKALKQEGLEPGVPDVCIAYPSLHFHGAYLECKTRTGQVSEKQKEWIAKLREAGYYCAVCIGFEEMKAATEYYFGEG